jgi:hypothetical protein
MNEINGVRQFDRAPEAMSCSAVQFTGPRSLQNLQDFAPDRIDFWHSFNRYIFLTEGWYLFLEDGDWLVRGIDGEGDVYLIRRDKFPRLWKER